MSLEDKLVNFVKYKDSLVPGDISLIDYIYFTSYPDTTISNIKLLFPDFIEYKNMIFLKENFNNENVDNWINSNNYSKEQIEKVINHVHIRSLYQDRYSEIYNNEVFIYIAKYMLKTFRIQLKESFPDKNFNVEIIDELEDIQIVFYQVI